MVKVRRSRTRVDAPATNRRPASGTRRRGSERHEEKRLAILQQAGLLFSEKGFANVTVSDISKRLQITRAAVYYYFADLQELAYECYRREFEFSDGVYADAARNGRNGLEKVQLIIRAFLADDVRRMPFIAEIDALKPEQQEIIRKQRDASVAVFHEFILEGVRDGSIRQGFDWVATFAILGAISSGAHLFPPMPELEFGQIAAGLADVFCNGLAARTPDKSIAVSPVIERIVTAPHIGFNRDAQVMSRVEALLRAATTLFNRHGVNATSLEDIVTSLHVSKGAFYHYCATKDELLYKCYERTADLMDRILEQSESEVQSGRGVLELFIRYLIRVNGSEAGPLAFFFGAQSLPADKQQAIYRRLARVEHFMRKWINRGMLDGSIRICDIEMARLAIDGALRWLPKWYWLDGMRQNPGRVEDELSRLFFEGLARNESPAAHD